MSYILSWLVPNRVIEMVLPSNANDDAVLAALDAEINVMLDTASQPVHVMLDVRTMKEYPSASTAMKMKYYKHPKLAQLIIIGLTANPVLRFLGGLVGKGVGIQMRDFGSREEALAYLASLERA